MYEVTENIYFLFFLLGWFLIVIFFIFGLDALLWALFEFSILEWIERKLTRGKNEKF